MQRNNIAMHYPATVKAEMVRLREVDGITPGELRERMAERYPDLPKIHTRTWACWSRSPEYRQLKERILEWDKRMAPRRWAALVQNAGQGPQTVADLAEMAVLEQLYALAESGSALESGDIVKVARAITTMQRTQIARRTEETDGRIAAIEQEHAAEVAELQAEIQRMRQQLERTVAALEHKTGDVDPGERRRLIDAVNEYMTGPR